MGLALPGGRSLRARIWLAQVGRVPLLLLDSDVEENDLGERGVTDRLYGGGSEHRLLQEMLLGIGGVRAVRAYCRLTGHAAPEAFHTNEGHAGFLGLERIAELGAEGLEFDAALEAVRAGTVFTTHTPVPAGIDRFDRGLVARHFGPDAELPGIDVDRVIELGRETYPGGEPGLFNMAVVMGLRLAQRANGVSLLHGSVSREVLGALPQAEPALRYSSTVQTTRQGARTTPASVTVTSTPGAARSAEVSNPTPRARCSSQVRTASEPWRKTASPSPRRVRTCRGWNPEGRNPARGSRRHGRR
ncbi:hypothetical protein SHIRM173S_05681 [Streptomyces hirsutus]